MPFTIVRNDITNMQTDAIVNTANPHPVIGAGVDSIIHKKAGPALLQARQKIGDIPRGCAAITPAFRLNAKYVIHTVGPFWDQGSYGEAELLRSCYENSLKLAVAHGCQSIAFPLIATGNYGFPKDKALQIAIAAFSTFLLEQDMDIYLVVFDKTSYQLSEKLFQGIASYIDENYVTEHTSDTVFRYKRPRASLRPRRIESLDRGAAPMPVPCTSASMAAPKAASLEEMLKKADAGFTETLLKRIDETGKKDSEIYKKANLTKQHFSKIRNDPQYKPKKSTALALAVALELSVAETQDLIGRAGFALTNSSKQDLIVRYFLEQKNYDIVEINVALYEFDQELLGSH